MGVDRHFWPCFETGASMQAVITGAWLVTWKPRHEKINKIIIKAPSTTKCHTCIVTLMIGNWSLMKLLVHKLSNANALLDQLASCYVHTRSPFVSKREASWGFICLSLHYIQFNHSISLRGNISQPFKDFSLCRKELTHTSQTHKQDGIMEWSDWNEWNGIN